MKKTYKKPIIVVEGFSAQEVLCACAVINTNPSEQMQCAFEDLGYMLFATTWASCQRDGNVHGYCYQPGPASSNVFSS